VAERLVTERLVLRSWRLDDADAALGIYGEADVARWLSPAMDRAPDEPAMRLLLQQWVAEDSRMVPPAGRWAIETRDDRRLVGGAILLPLPPGDVDLEMGWQLHPSAWGRGYATEAGRAIARWAFSQGIDEVLAVVRAANRRAEATARRIGMEWVGETEKYFGLRLQVFRLRPPDLDAASDASNRTGRTA
jgi:RimJ/RimL family protein N-acetyltransferase